MHLNLKILKSIMVVIIIFLFLSQFFLYTSLAEIENDGFNLLGFDSFIEIEIDTSSLDDPLYIEKSYIIPIMIKYYTDIPIFFKYLPRFILFRTFSSPIQKIHLEIYNPPDWADISINPSDVLTYIPFDGEDAEVLYSYMILSLDKDSPATAYRMDLIASCDKIGILNGDSKTTQMIFTPEWIPGLEINDKKSILNIDFYKNISFPINITNDGNSNSLVSIDLINDDIDFDPFEIFIEPSILSIDTKETKQVFISIYSLKNNFYSIYYKSIMLNFTPWNSNTNEKGEVYPFYINLYLSDLQILLNP